MLSYRLKVSSPYSPENVLIPTKSENLKEPPPFAGSNQSAGTLPCASTRATRPCCARSTLEGLAPRRYSALSAWITSTRAARMAGTADATTAAVSSTTAAPATGSTPGIFSSPTTDPASCASQ